jgi:hypothetical protein
MAFYAGFLTGVLAAAAAAFFTLLAIAIGAGRAAKRMNPPRPSAGAAPPLPRVTP